MDLNYNLKQYAKLLVYSGLNVQEGQLVVIQSTIEAYALVREIVKYCFERKAKDVIVRYSDEIVDHERFLNKPASDFEQYPEYDALMFNQTAKEGAGYLLLVGDDPDLMSDIESNKIQSFYKAKNMATLEYRNGRQQLRNSWCIGAVSTEKWAKKVFPNSLNPVEDLWDAIFKVARVYGDPIQNWENHKNSFLKRMDVINHLDIESLHYKNSKGTDFTCGLPEKYFFLGGGSELNNGVYYFPNMPTEELFAAPHRLKCNGKLVASLPLCHNGAMIEDFWFEFKDGKVVDFDARVGKDVLQSILDTDENASYLGEVALVPFDSPISNLQTIFYETLLDENASCHFALGTAYSESIEGGISMSNEELLAHGLNYSMTHVDFMVGTSDLSIIATCKDGREVVIFENGNFSSVFD